MRVIGILGAFFTLIWLFLTASYVWYCVVLQMAFEFQNECIEYAAERSRAQRAENGGGDATATDTGNQEKKGDPSGGPPETLPNKKVVVEQPGDKHKGLPDSVVESSTLEPGSPSVGESPPAHGHVPAATPHPEEAIPGKKTKGGLGATAKIPAEDEAKPKVAEALTKEKTTEDPPGKKPPESAKTKGAKAAVPESEDEKAAEKVPRYPPPGGVPEKLYDIKPLGFDEDWD